MRKSIGVAAAIVVAIAASFTMSQAAGAQYPPVVCVVTINPASVAPGATATLSGSVTTNNGPAAVGSPVSFSINGEPLGSTTTGEDGSFSLVVTIPDLPAGTYSIVADCGAGPDGDVLGNTDVVITDGNGGNTNPPGGNNQGNNQGNQGGNQGNQGGNQGNQSGGNLARTGTDLGLPVQIGIGLLALGGIILALSASRRRTSAA